MQHLEDDLATNSYNAPLVAPTAIKMPFDINRFTYVIENDNQDKRAQLKEFIGQNLATFTPRYDVSLRYTREIAFERLKKVAENGYISGILICSVGRFHIVNCTHNIWMYIVFDFERVSIFVRLDF